MRALGEEVLPLSPSYDRYSRQPIGIGERQRHRRRVSSRRQASMTVNGREVAQSEPRPSAAYPHELTVEEPFAGVAEVHEAST